LCCGASSQIPVFAKPYAGEPHPTRDDLTETWGVGLVRGLFCAVLAWVSAVLAWVVVGFS
jgi:hypothetical protein